MEFHLVRVFVCFFLFFFSFLLFCVCLCYFFFIDFIDVSCFFACFCFVFPSLFVVFCLFFVFLFVFCFLFVCFFLFLLLCCFVFCFVFVCLIFILLFYCVFRSSVYANTSSAFVWMLIQLIIAVQRQIICNYIINLLMWWWCYLPWNNVSILFHRVNHVFLCLLCCFVAD